MSLLGKTPMFDGKTTYCNKDFHLTNGNLKGLEKSLISFNNSGAPLGTRMFGSPPFEKGKLSTSQENLGLPRGVHSPVTIEGALPDIYKQGGPLPRPYGPIDNRRMQLPYYINGFGKKRKVRKSRVRKSRARKSRVRKSRVRKSRVRKSRARKSRARKSRARKSRARKSRERRGSKKFGTTPGTPEWRKQAVANNRMSNFLNSQTNGGLVPAKAYVGNTVLQYGLPGKNPRPMIGSANVPGNYTNNQLNTPFLKSFGSTAKALNPGPNTVAYQKPIPTYHAGGNTINFLTNKKYLPDIVSRAGAVMPDGMTDRAWLTQSKGLEGTGQTKVNNGFGSMVYSGNNMSRGSGTNVIMQPMSLSKPEKVTGNYMGFGKDNSKRGGKGNKKPLSGLSNRSKEPKERKLRASFGGSVITLDNKGKISFSKN